jgi:ribosomal protein S18 acetylase RimI-like enzyme
MKVEVVKASYLNEQHKHDIPMLLNEYSLDPMGGGQALSEDVKVNLVNELSKLPHAFTVIAYIDNQPAGLINCFEGFSTFSCKPLINVHDVIVLKQYRGNNISQVMLKEVEKIARAKGCCKITLEVLSKNELATLAYNKFGFKSYELDPKMGVALFLEKRCK